MLYILSNEDNMLGAFPGCSAIRDKSVERSREQIQRIMKYDKLGKLTRDITDIFTESNKMEFESLLQPKL